MKAKKYWILVIVSFSILIVLWPAQQITGETDLSAKDEGPFSNLMALEKLASSCKRVTVNDKEILQGLEGVYVWVGDIHPMAEKYGLRGRDLQTDTELQLRQYGIKVLTAKELASTPGVPFLRIEVSVVIGGEGPFAATAIRVGLVESVLLLREPKRICLGACTWQRGYMWRVASPRMNTIREYVKDFVNQFINDYLAANPKETKAKSKW